MFSGKRVEVTATADLDVPSRFQASETAASATVDPALDANTGLHTSSPSTGESSARDLDQGAAGRGSFDVVGERSNRRSEAIAPAHEDNYRERFRRGLRDQAADLHSMVEGLAEQSRDRSSELPAGLFRLYTELIDAELDEELARDLVQKLQASQGDRDPQDDALLRARACRLVEDDLRVCGPIELRPGACRTVALVGPTGVGKTTTIAKLAANFGLRDRRRVGLITVDTYRIAAVEQLRTYAEIIDLPMEVVSTPREMRDAADRLSELDLVLVDTAGRSPRDEVKIRELNAFLAEARVDDVLLVLSGVTSASSLKSTAHQFQQVGVTSLLITKLDEAMGLGCLWQLQQNCRLPFSYVTNGQNVPDDIRPADARRLARAILGQDTI
jgi:flagellar biosynthesis protein FlhF